jgi:phytoene dehydrogenase-like protein
MNKHVVIIGGGLAGLSAGCYARASGFRTTLVEHNLSLGGVCTAWSRGEYTVDGCIHWLTGGPFMRLYEELGIVPAVAVRTIEHWLTWRDGPSGGSIEVTRDLDRLARDLIALAPQDEREIRAVVDGARRLDLTPPGVVEAPELATWTEQLRAIWEMKDSFGTLVHFRKPVETWAEEHLSSGVLRRFFASLVPEAAPALLVPFVLGYLQRGHLSRPVGGTAAFRDALVATYDRLGGERLLPATVDEVLVDNGRARGVRLGDGTMLSADAVISTSSSPETLLRLLGGRFGASKALERTKDWKMFQPIVLASWGIAAPLADAPPMLLVDSMPTFEIGGTRNHRLYLRVCNDDPSVAPPGHALVQALLPTDYAWWASRGAGYEDAKEEVAGLALEQIERVLPVARDRVRMVDVATPLTYWQKTRSWRGAYEGWMPNSASLFAHVPKTLPALDAFYMAGQWVEPGGGVPTAVMSGREAVQLLCVDTSQSFVAWPCRGEAPRA